jgi:hypothetical protein
MIVSKKNKSSYILEISTEISTDKMIWFLEFALKKNPKSGKVEFDWWNTLAISGSLLKPVTGTWAHRLKIIWYMNVFQGQLSNLKLSFL